MRTGVDGMLTRLKDACSASTDKRRSGHAQFAKFALVGFVSLAVEYSLLLGLVEGMHVDYMMGTTLAFSASIVVNYFLSLRYVFAHRAGMSRTREFTIFAILSAVGLGLNDLYMFVGVGMLNIGYQAMKLISTFFVTWYNYLSRKRFLSSRA